MQNTRRLKSVFKKLPFFSEVKNKPVYSGSYGRIHFKEVLTWTKHLEFGEGLGNEGHFRVINCNSFLVNENIMGDLNWIYCLIMASVYMNVQSVVSNSLQPLGLQPARLLCLWKFSGKNAGMGCYFLLQGIFLTQGLKLCLLHLHTDMWSLYH